MGLTVCPAAVVAVPVEVVWENLVQWERWSEWALPSTRPPAASNMAETSSSPQAGGVGSSKHLAPNQLRLASSMVCRTSSVPLKDSISTRRRKGKRGHVLLAPRPSFQCRGDEQGTSLRVERQSSDPCMETRRP